MENIFVMLLVIFITLIPTLELRASIPFGILSGENYLFVFLVAIITNIMLAPLVYLFLDKVIHLFFNFKWFYNLYHRVVDKTQKKVRPYVDKYGEFGLALFISIPLPGSGVYSGVLFGYLLGLNYKKMMIASIIGVIFAGVIVTIISLGIFSGLDFLIKQNIFFM
jgi:uncharacterized membrane protein